MSDWTTCPHCTLEHDRRHGGHCPRCMLLLVSGGASPSELVAAAAALRKPAYLNGAFGELASGQPESVRMWWGIALMHKMLGPTITVAAVGLAGAALTWRVMRRLGG